MGSTTGELPLVLVTHPLPADWLAPLDGQCRLVIGEQDAPTISQNVLDHLSEAEGLFTLLTDKVDETLLAQAPNLRVVSNMAVGVDNIDLQACTRRGILVGNTPGVLTAATADLAMGLILAAARGLKAASQDALQGHWTTWTPTGWLGIDLHESTLGIIGMGKIGQAVAQRAQAFDVRIVYTSRTAKEHVEAALGATRLPPTQLLQESDVVSLHVPLTDETFHLIDAHALQQMKPTAYLVNTARGPVVDTQALLQALREGWIAGAALDVTDPEPLPADHPLYGLPNCLITPHIGSATVGTRRAMARLACMNLLAGLAGERLPHCANPQVYES
jgi:glyoxylate reductase